MGKFIDITGMKFNKLTAIEIDHSGTKGVYWKCRCDCGNETIVPAVSLRNESIKSCGCLRLENFNKNKRAHGMTNTRPFSIWSHITQRCLNPNNTSYKNYGGRGITVCDKWLTFKGFWEDMQEGYDDNLSIDRINVDGNYCKENCRWATKEEQLNNKRTNVTLTINGVTQNIIQHCKRVGIDYRLVWWRLKQGQDYETAILTPPKKQNKH